MNVCRILAVLAWPRKLFAIHGDDDPWQENSGKKKGLELCAAEVKFVFGNEAGDSLLEQDCWATQLFGRLGLMESDLPTTGPT